MESLTIAFDNTRHALAVRARAGADGAQIAAALGLTTPRSLLMVSGGASEMSAADVERLRGPLAGIARLVAQEHVAIIDGGTQAGVMQLIGQGRAALGGDAPLIGVCPAALVTWPAGPRGTDRVSLDPNHTHFVLTDGYRWGAETETMFALAAFISARAPSLAVLANGGAVARKELLRHVSQSRLVIVLAGSGRLADEIAAAAANTRIADQQIAAIVRDGRIAAFDIADGPAALATLIQRKLFEKAEPPRERKDRQMPEFNKLEEYKLFVEDTARFSERRQTISNIYVGVNSLLLLAIGLWATNLGGRSMLALLLPLPLVAAGISVCIWWRQLIGKYKKLVGFRIDRLREMEDQMPDSAKMYQAEDEIYPRDSGGKMIPGEGLNFADLEKRLPWLFMALYAIFGAGLLLVLFVRFLAS